MTVLVVRTDSAGEIINASEVTNLACALTGDASKAVSQLNELWKVIVILYHLFSTDFCTAEEALADFWSLHESACKWLQRLRSKALLASSDVLSFIRKAQVFQKRLEVHRDCPPLKTLLQSTAAVLQIAPSSLTIIDDFFAVLVLWVEENSPRWERHVLYEVFCLQELAATKKVLFPSAILSSF